MKFGFAISLLALLALSPAARAETDDAAKPAPCVKLKLMTAGAPDSMGTTCEGNRAGQNLVLNFFATWCHYCVEELPLFTSIANEFKDKAVFRLVGEDERELDLRNFFAQRDHNNFGILFDLKNEALDLFKIDGTPTTVIVGPDKMIKYTHLGTFETPKEIEDFKRAITE